MKKNKTAIIFFGDFFYDARCFNMVNTLSENNSVVDVFHLGDDKNSFPVSSLVSVYNISIYKIKYLKYFSWFCQVNN